VGLQDLYLRGSWSPFAWAFRRATRFASWTDAVDIPYTPGQRAGVDVPKSGDILGDVWLRVTLPAIPSAPVGATWKKCIGYTLLRRVRFMLDGQEIHNYERLWYDIYDKIYASKTGYDAMIGRTPLPVSKAHELFIPLRFLTETLGFPLSAIPRASLKVDIEWERTDALTTGLTLTADPGISASLLVDYYDLDTPEKIRMTQGASLAFESAIDSDALSYSVDSGGEIRDLPTVKVNLGNVRFAVKYLAWVAYDETGPLFTYLDRPLSSLSLTFNRQERMTPRPSEYYDVVQKYQHCSRCAGIEPPGVYSFAYDATSKKPSGTADFGGLSQAYLQGDVAPGNPRFKLKVFSLYYNFIDIRNGTGRLIFV
jgi:hypothetical protein